MIYLAVIDSSIRVKSKEEETIDLNLRLMGKRSEEGTRESSRIDVGSTRSEGVIKWSKLYFQNTFLTYYRGEFPHFIS